MPVSVPEPPGWQRARLSPGTRHRPRRTRCEQGRARCQRSGGCRANEKRASLLAWNVQLDVLGQHPGKKKTTKQCSQQSEVSHLSGTPSQDLVHLIFPRELGEIRLRRQEVLGLVGKIVQAFQCGMGKGLSAMSIRGSGGSISGALRQSQGSL